MSSAPQPQSPSASGPSAAPGPDPLVFRRALGRFATGVTVVTTVAADGTPVGLTVNSFNSVSLEPPLVLWSLRRESPTLPLFQAAPRFAVNVLAEDQTDLSNRFASPVDDRFAGMVWETGALGVPLLPGCAARLECRTEAIHPGGDHLIFIGRVERVDCGDRPPLIYANGRYMITAPHPAGR